MYLAIDFIPVFAFFIFPIVSSIESRSDYVVNTTSGIISSFESIKKALRDYGFDPMILSDASEQSFQGKPILTNGVLTGSSIVTVCGDWSLKFSGSSVRSGGRVCAKEINGKFTYTDKYSLLYRKCILDVSMKDVAADMDVLYTLGEKTLTDPRITVSHVGETKMFLDKCGRFTKRIRLSKNLETFYESLIINQGMETAVQLGIRANEAKPVVNFYTDFVEGIQKSRIPTN